MPPRAANTALLKSAGWKPVHPTFQQEEHEVSRAQSPRFQCESKLPEK